jgi:Leucine-rich repeat (LRR) protein
MSNLILEAAETQTNVLDLSRKGLKKIPKIEDSQSIRHLILDENELAKIDNIDSYLRIEKVIDDRIIDRYASTFFHFFLF